MSYETIRTLTATCQCGNGRIIQEIKMDDWNRIQDSQAVIECEKCNSIYKVEIIKHYRQLPSDGYWSSYYLIPRNYPEYDGPNEDNLYPKKTNRYEDFSVWLIENYTENELRDALTQLKSVASSTKLTGIAAKIRDAHKKAKRTVRVKIIAGTVELVLKKYSGHLGNKLQREEIKKKEEESRAAYEKEKSKHRIEIELR